MIIKRLRGLGNRQALQVAGQVFLAFLGASWLLIELGQFFFPAIVRNDRQLLVLALGGATTFAFVRALPPIRFVRHSRVSNIEVELRVGDLFAQDLDVAMLCNDCIDITSPKSSSLITKLVKRWFDGDRNLLAEEIARSLERQGVEGVIDATKKFGNQVRFQPGTTAIVSSGDRKAYIVVGPHIDNDGVITMNTTSLWESLSGLWKNIEKNGDLKPVALPVWGGGLARASAPRVTLIALAVSSFLLANSTRRISEKLIVAIAPHDYQPGEFLDVVSIIKAIDF